MAASVILVRRGDVVKTSSGAVFSVDEPLPFGKGSLWLETHDESYVVVCLNKAGNEVYRFVLFEDGEFLFAPSGGSRSYNEAEQAERDILARLELASEQEETAAQSTRLRRGRRVWHELKGGLRCDYTRLRPDQVYVGKEWPPSGFLWEAHGGTMTRRTLPDGHVEVTIAGAEWAILVKAWVSFAVTWGDPTNEFFVRLAKSDEDLQRAAAAYGTQPMF